MRKQFLHLAVNFEFPSAAPTPDLSPPGPVTVGNLMKALTVGVPSDPLAGAQKAIEIELNRATDWIRYAPNCWIVYTGRTAKTWYRRLADISGMKDHTFFVCELNLDNRGGWIPKSVWEWINRDRSDG